MKKILLIESMNKELRSDLKDSRALKRRNIAVFTASSLEEAETLLKEESFDLIFLDHELLEGMFSTISTYDFLEKIKKFYVVAVSDISWRNTEMIEKGCKTTCDKGDIIKFSITTLC